MSCNTTVIHVQYTSENMVIAATPTPVISNRMKREATLNMPSDDGETTENTTPTEVSQTTNNTGATSGDVTRMTTTFEPADVNFTVVILTSGCRNWDEPTQTWTARGCTVCIILLKYINITSILIYFYHILLQK